MLSLHARCRAIDWAYPTIKMLQRPAIATTLILVANVRYAAIAAGQACAVNFRSAHVADVQAAATFEDCLHAAESWLDCRNRP